MTLASALPLTPLNVTGLVRQNYEAGIVSFIEGADRIQNLSSIIKYRNQDVVLLCDDCSSQSSQAWNDLIVNYFGLISHGVVDGVIRGMHKESLFLRYLTNRLLIVASNSEYSELVRQKPYLPSGVRAQESREVLRFGGGSCEQVCARFGLRCEDQRMVMANDCTYLKTQLQCMCEKDRQLYGPYLHNGTCYVTELRDLNCSDKTEQTSTIARLCICI